jgi:hypothetical protein
MLASKDAPNQVAQVDVTRSATFLKRGHFLSYAGLVLFTVVLYARPSEFYPSALTASLALFVGLLTLTFYLPAQLALEGTPTKWLPEVKLLLLFVMTGALSIPFANDPSGAWTEFSGVFIRAVVICIVVVNVVRSERRLRGLLFLTIITALWLSLGAINDYRLGLMTVEGYRVGGRGSGIFGNSNDMALFLVTVIPVMIAMLLNQRRTAGKILFGTGAALVTTGILLTYSRGAFIGLFVSLAFLTWKVGGKHRVIILVSGLLFLILFLVAAPGGYGLRLASIFIPSLDPVGSADARRGELFRSLYVALRHPLFGIGMGNYVSTMSYDGRVTHNSYTQVASEMGLAALVCYTTFIVSPLRKLGQIARETLKAPNSHFHYLALGLQASLLAYLVCSFFASVAYLWYVYYLVGYAVCLRRLYESETGREVVVVKKRTAKKKPGALHPSVLTDNHGAVTA